MLRRPGHKELSKTISSPDPLRNDLLSRLNSSKYLEEYKQEKENSKFAQR
ncbi:MAG: hypothetical protein ACOC5L_01610 [Halobacteriota archaeon]